MSREIKFRVWDNIYKNYEDTAENWFRDELELFMPERELLVASLDILQRHPERYVIEQLTGLKDSNGTDIYEGDIIQSDNVSYSPFAVVVYVDYEARYAPCEKESYLMGKRDGDLFNQPGEPWMLYACRVVGNIHENSSLL